MSARNNKSLTKHFYKTFKALFDAYYQCRDESLLMDLSNLGNKMVQAAIPPEVTVEFFENAKAECLQNFPNIDPNDTQSNLVLMELITAYGLNFRRMIEEQKKHSNAQFFKVLEQSSDHIFICDNEKKITYANPAFLNTFKKSYTADSSLPVFLPYEECDEPNDMFKALSKKGRWKGKLATKDAEGKSRVLSITAFSIQENIDTQLNQFVFISEDITAELLSQKRVNQAKRFEALGELASGISHEFNNVMLIMSGFAELLRDEVTSEKGINHIDEILAAIEKGKRLNQQILSFSSKPSDNNEKHSFPNLLLQANQYLASAIGPEITLTISSGPNIKVSLSEENLCQMLVNLCLNARHAIEEKWSQKNEGQIIISYSHFKNSSWVEIKISDNGVGMDESTKKQIFEPFFTTKDVGKGTGLGLSLLQKQVNEYRGYVQVISEKNLGTQVSIFLPVVITGDLDEQTDIPERLTDQLIRQQINTTE